MEVTFSNPQETLTGLFTIEELNTNENIREVVAWEFSWKLPLVTKK